MNLETDRKKGLARWIYQSKEVRVKVPQICYAYQYGTDLVMVKSENDAYDFYLFHMDGRIILCYKSGKKGALRICDTFTMAVDDLISLEYSEQYQIIAMLCGDKPCSRKLYLLNGSGEALTQISCPAHFCFSSLKTCNGDLMAVCCGDETTIDKYGRNDWNFKVHLDNYYLEKQSVTQ